MPAWICHHPSLAFVMQQYVGPSLPGHTFVVGYRAAAAQYLDVRSMIHDPNYSHLW
jgi:hypothetical protein